MVAVRQQGQQLAAGADAHSAPAQGLPGESLQRVQPILSRAAAQLVEHQVRHAAATGVAPRSSKAVAITWIRICVHSKHPKHW